MKPVHTKFILHGGFNPEQLNEDNYAFYEEILRDASDDAKILLVPFAKDTDRISVAIAKVSKRFEEVRGTKNISISVATEEGFINQIKNSDIVYFHGGVSLKLLNTLKQYPDIKTFLQGKVVAGESAGANVLCKLFYSPRAEGVFEGLGLLPIKIIPHYKDGDVVKLDGTDPALEVLLLPEYQFKVFEV